MTEEEWILLQEFLVTPTTSQYGFCHAMLISEIYNEVPSLEESIPLLCIVANQLPWTNEYDRAPTNAWETFSRYTHTSKQEQYRKFLKIDIPLNKRYYEY